jgi:hypothetical protein
MRIADFGLRNVKVGFERHEDVSTPALKFRNPHSAIRNRVWL